MIGRSRTAYGALVLAAACAVAPGGSAYGQGLVQGVQEGSKAGSRAAGPVGGVLGGAIGGVVGVVGGVLGVAKPPPPQADKTQPPPLAGKPVKGAKTAAKPSKSAPQPAAAPAPPAQMTPEQIVATSDANIERIKTELKLTGDQEKHWTAFNSAMHYLGHNGADRLTLRATRAKRDPPDDIIEQMRNEAQFLYDRGNDQRNVADAAEPLFTSLDDAQKRIFIEEMVRLSLERGLD